MDHVSRRQDLPGVFSRRAKPLCLHFPTAIHQTLFRNRPWPTFFNVLRSISFAFGLSSNVHLTESQMETHSDFLHHAVLAVK
jgi:hypothetical protein